MWSYPLESRAGQDEFGGWDLFLTAHSSSLFVQRLGAKCRLTSPILSLPNTCESHVMVSTSDRAGILAKLPSTVPDKTPPQGITASSSRSADVHVSLISMQRESTPEIEVREEPFYGGT